MPANVHTYIMYSYILAAGTATVPTPTQYLELARLVYTVHCIYIHVYTQENRSPSPIIPCTTLQPSAAATSNIHPDDIITDQASSRGDVRRIPLGNGYLFVNSTSCSALWSASSALTLHTQTGTAVRQGKNAGCPKSATVYLSRSVDHVT